MEQINVIWVALAAFLGAMALSMMGWISSGETFNPRKFIGSAITAVIAGVGVAVTFDYSQGITLINILMAFLIGTGADASRKAVADAIRKVPSIPVG